MSHLLSALQLFGGRRLPIIRQTEVAECGLACLAMVAGFHGLDIDLSRLRQRFSLSSKGMTLGGLVRCADRLDMASRALSAPLSELTTLRLPCVLHWDLNHFVVLASTDGRRAVIHDPAYGRRVIDYDELSKHYTGIALELTPTEAFQPGKDVARLRLSDFARNVPGLRASLTKVLGLSLILQFFALLAPFYQQLVVDEVLTSFDGDLLLVLAIGFGLLLLITSLTTLLRQWLMLALSNLFSFQMSVRLARHLFRLPLDWFEKRHIGDVMARFDSLSQIQSQLTSGLVGAVVDGLMALATLAMMFVYAPRLGWIVLASVLLYGLVRGLSYDYHRRLSETQIVAGAKEQSNFMETVRAMPSVRMFGKETERLMLWQNRLAERFNAGIALGKFNLGYSGVNQLVFGLQNILVIYFGARMAMESALSVGMLFAFLSYKEQFVTRASALIEQWINLKMLDLHLSRLADVALAKTEANLEGERREQPLDGAVEAAGLSFRYAESEPWIFRDLHFRIEPGESVAIVGPSGCGKTTLLKMLMGLVEPSEGEVRADGHDIRRLGLLHYRSQIAAVLQDDQLLSGSLLDNICFFDPQIDVERAEVCARAAALHDDIVAMPMGYHSLVGDMGTSLSGGQKQRLLLARALYRQPKILFLDEATSHLDVALEQRVNEAIRSMQITRILIAHRPDTIKSADRVINLAQIKQARSPATSGRAAAASTVQA
ncbi:peptidase domain-containing ABC transporter [Chitinimonas lacunae]|uniref:Peptidase domain-containing ABC transporter n=1 Tax=Chitinimonas lacunae TaxID=1963018 RepID=A0ABV8MNS7_9NEIS